MAYNIAIKDKIILDVIAIKIQLTIKQHNNLNLVFRI